MILPVVSYCYLDLIVELVHHLAVVVTLHIKTLNVITMAYDNVTLPPVSSQ